MRFTSAKFLKNSRYRFQISDDGCQNCLADICYLTSDYCSGGADRDRTDDPLVANQVLSQLSYSPAHQLPDLTLQVSDSVTALCNGRPF